MHLDSMPDLSYEIKGSAALLGYSSQRQGPGVAGAREGGRESRLCSTSRMSAFEERSCILILFMYCFHSTQLAFYAGIVQTEKDQGNHLLVPGA